MLNLRKSFCIFHFRNTARPIPMRRIWRNFIPNFSVLTLFTKEKVPEFYSNCGTLDTIKKFLFKLGMKPHIHLVEISIFSLNNVTKIMIDLLEHLKNLTDGDISRVFLLRQLWIVNYYVKSSSNNLSNKNKTLCVSKEMILQK